MGLKFLLTRAPTGKKRWPERPRQSFEIQTMANSCRGSCHSRRDLLSGIVPSSLSLHPTKVRPGGDQEVAVTGNVCPEPAVAEESRGLFCSPRGILAQAARCGQRKTSTLR